MTLAFIHATALCPDRDAMRIRRIDDATVVVQDGQVVSLESGLAPPPGASVIDAGGRLLTPGLVDCHTHLLFLGDRAAEFCERAAGATYLQIAERGGGIQSTVKATRGATADERRRAASSRLTRLARNGVTTVEVKTGYGLSREDELAHLREIHDLQQYTLLRVSPTFMAAHALPPEVKTEKDRAEWVRVVADELIPEAAALASRIDIFVERSAYTHAETRRIATSARKHGMAVHLHVDQLSDGNGGSLAAAVGARAAAHLERVTRPGIEALARAGTVAVLLPTATLAAGEPAYAPARALITAGVRIALSTNLNPGTGPSESTSLTFFLAAIALHMAADEILWASTRGGALALGLDAQGLLEVGAPADLVLWNVRELAHLPYHAGVNHVRLVMRDGSVIVDRAAEADLECDGKL